MLFKWSRLGSVDRMASIYFLCVILLILITGVYGHSMDIDDYLQANAITSCKNGLIADVDNLTITAHISPMFDTIQSGALLSFQMYKPSDSFDYSLCHLYLSESYKIIRGYRGCYFKQDFNGTFEIMLNKKAELEDSNGDVFLKWSAVGSLRPRETRTIKLPVVYQQAQKSLYVGNSQVSVGSSCTAFFRPGDVLRWCVKNLLTHNLTIAFDYGVFVSSEECVQHEFRIYQATSSYFNISYEELEGCERSEVITCNWHGIVQTRHYSYSFSCGDFALYGALICGLGVRYMGPRILDNLGFIKTGIRKSSYAGLCKLVVQRANAGQTVLAFLQTAGRKGNIDWPFCSLFALIGSFLGMLLQLLLMIILLLIILIILIIRFIWSYISGF